MKSTIRMGSVLLTVLFVAALATAQEKRSVSLDPQFTWRGNLEQGKTVTVIGLNGKVRASYAPDNTVEVRAEKTARENGNPDEVFVEVFEHANGVTLCAIHTKNKPEPGRCLEDGTSRGWNLDNAGRNVRLDFHVKVPKGVRFVGRTTNGGIEALDMQSVVHAETTNGGIKISTSEYATAETTNGGITVEMGKADWSEPVKLETTNGGIDVVLPGDATFQVEAETTNGNISTDFEITTSGGVWRRNRLRGAVGGGGRNLLLETTNGSIKLRKQASL